METIEQIIWRRAKQVAKRQKLSLTDAVVVVCLIHQTETADRMTRVLEAIERKVIAV